MEKINYVKLYLNCIISRIDKIIFNIDFSIENMLMLCVVSDTLEN